MTAREKKVPPAASPDSVLTGWARQGVQSFVAAQKILMDLAAQENALLIGMAREGLSRPGARIGAVTAGIAEKGVKNLATVGKILLDLAAEETALAVEGVKEGFRLPAPAGAVAEVVRHRVDTIIEMQKILLDATAEQAKAIAESYREGEKFLNPAHVTELAQKGLKGIVENEKKFLDLAGQEANSAAKPEKRAGKPPRERMEVFTSIAREGAEKYIETQKKLLELAIEQLEETTKVRREPKERAKKEVQPLWGELTEKSVKNLVTAEKSLLDLAMGPIHGREPKGAKGGRKGARAAKHTPVEAREEATATHA